METETPLNEALKLLAAPARAAVIVVLCTGAVVAGSYEAWSQISESRAAAMEQRIVPAEARITSLEASDRKRGDDIATIRSDVSVIKQILDDRLPPKH